MIHKNEAFMLNTKNYKTTRERKHLITFFLDTKARKDFFGQDSRTYTKYISLTKRCRAVHVYDCIRTPFLQDI